MTTKQKKTIERARTNWGIVAKEYGWYKEQFFIQVWFDENGEMIDSVSFKELEKDIIIGL